MIGVWLNWIFNNKRSAVNRAVAEFQRAPSQYNDVAITYTFMYETEIRLREIFYLRKYPDLL